MKLPRRQFLHLAAGAAAVPVVSRFAWAQAYPTRPVRIVVGFAAGGGADIIARLIGQWLSERLGRQFIVENRPGAGSNIAAETMVRSPADGYTLLLVSSPHAFNATLYDKLNYNFIRDIAPVASATLVPGVMEVNPLVSAKTVPEFIAYAKVNPGKINMAANCAGSATHIFGELFKMMAGVDLATVQYRGSGPALTDLIGGQVEVMFDALSSSIEHIRAGRLRPLAVTTATRFEICAELRGGYLAGHRRTQEHAARDRRQAQQGDQCGTRRSQDEGAVCRPGSCGVRRFARRLWKVYRQRNREVGQGGPGGQDQGGLRR